MKVLVTGGAGQLGEGLVRHLDQPGINPFGLDIKRSAFTRYAGSIADTVFKDGPYLVDETPEIESGHDRQCCMADAFSRVILLPSPRRVLRSR